MNKINASSTTTLSNIDLLPSEVMVEIFNNVSTITLLSKCSLVNNLWHQVVKLNLKDRFTLCEISNTLFSIVKQELPFVTIETFYLCSKQIVEHLINKFNETQSLHVLYLVGALSQNINEDAKKIALTEDIFFESFKIFNWVATIDETIRTNIANFIAQFLPEESQLFPECTIDNPYTIKILLDTKNLERKENEDDFVLRTRRYDKFIYNNVLNFAKKTAFTYYIKPSEFYHHLLTFAHICNLYQSPIDISEVKNLKSKGECFKITEEFIQLLEQFAHEKFYGDFDRDCSTLLSIVKKKFFQERFNSNLIPLLCSQLCNKNYDLIRILTILTKQEFIKAMEETIAKQAYSIFLDYFYKVLFCLFLNNKDPYLQNLKTIFDVFFHINENYYVVNDILILRCLSSQFQTFNLFFKYIKVYLDELDEECKFFFTKL